MTAGHCQALSAGRDARARIGGDCSSTAVASCAAQLEEGVGVTRL